MGFYIFIFSVVKGRFLLNGICWEFANSSRDELASCPGTLASEEIARLEEEYQEEKRGNNEEK